MDEPKQSYGVGRGDPAFAWTIIAVVFVNGLLLTAVEYLF